MACLLQKQSSVTRKPVSLLSRQEGSTFVEYVIVLGFVALVVAAAMAALGVPLLKHYRFVQFVISAPIP